MTLRFSASSAMAGLAVGAILAGGVVWASGSLDASGEQVCRTKAGYLRISSTGECRRSEFPIEMPQGPQGEQGLPGGQGEPGPAASIAIGNVTVGPSAAATLTGDAPNQRLDLVLPQNDRCTSSDKQWFGCDFRGAKFDYWPLRNAVFDGADARGASFKHAELYHASFHGADLRDSDFSAATCTRDNSGNYGYCPVEWSYADLRGVDLSELKIRQESSGAASTFHGANVDSAKLPEVLYGGYQYSPVTYCWGEGVPASVPADWRLSGSCAVPRYPWGPG